MRNPSRAETVRATLAALTCTALAETLARVTTGLLDGALSAGASIDLPVAAVVVGLGAVAAAVLGVGCWLLAVASLARRVTGPATWCDRVGARLTPALLRRAVGLTVGAGLGVAALGGVAAASEPDLGWEVTSTATSETGSAASPEAAQPAPDPAPAGTPEPTPIPTVPVIAEPEERVAGRLASPSPAPPDDTEAGVATVTVRRGDSLWRIAAEHLHNASDAEIAEEWPRWYEANRAVIGSDPGLIHPGQVLRVPSDAPAGPAS